MFRRFVKFRYGSDIRKLPIVAPLRSIAELENVAYLLYQPKLSNSDGVKFMYIDADGDLINLRSDEDVRLAFENTAELLIYVLPGSCADGEEPCAKFQSSHIDPENETAGVTQHLAVLHALVLGIISKARNFRENAPGKQASKYRFECEKSCRGRVEVAEKTSILCLPGPTRRKGCANDTVTGSVSASNDGTTESTGTERFYSCRSQLELSSSLAGKRRAGKLQTAFPSSRDCVTSTIEEWYASAWACTRPYLDKAKSSLSAIQFQTAAVSEFPLHAKDINHTTPILVCAYGGTHKWMKTVPVWTNSWWTSSPVSFTIQGPQLLSEAEIQTIRLMKLEKRCQRLLFQGEKMDVSKHPPERHKLGKLKERGVQTSFAFGPSSGRPGSVSSNPHLSVLRSKTYKRPLGSQTKKTKSLIKNPVNIKKDGSAITSTLSPKSKQRSTRTMLPKNHKQSLYRITAGKVRPVSRTSNISTQSMDIKYCLDPVKEKKLMFMLLTAEGVIHFKNGITQWITNLWDDIPLEWSQAAVDIGGVGMSIRVHDLFTLFVAEHFKPIRVQKDAPKISFSRSPGYAKQITKKEMYVSAKPLSAGQTTGKVKELITASERSSLYRFLPKSFEQFTHQQAWQEYIIEEEALKFANELSEVSSSSTSLTNFLENIAASSETKTRGTDTQVDKKSSLPEPKAAHLTKQKFMMRRQVCLTNKFDDQSKRPTARLEGVRNDGFTKSWRELDDLRRNSHQNDDGEAGDFEVTTDLLPPLGVLMLAVESVPSMSEFSVRPMDSKFSRPRERCQENLQYLTSQRQNNHNISGDLQKYEAERQKMYTTGPSSAIITGAVSVGQWSFIVV